MHARNPPFEKFEGLTPAGLRERIDALGPAAFEEARNVLVQDGRLIEKNMKRERLTLDDLAEEARKQNIASFDDIAWAVMETSGEISFIKKSDS